MKKCQPREFYERPLTPEETQFAADNLGLVYWFLNQQKLNRDEWFDVVIFGYMLAVKKYVCLPDTQKYPFYNTACLAMRSSLANERRNQKKQIETVRLYDPIPGTDALVYMDMVTAENLNFVAYTKEGEVVKITYNVPVPEKTSGGARKCAEIMAIEKFLQGKEKTMCFEYETPEEARQRASVIWAYRRRLAKLHIYYEACKMGNCIYITKGQRKEVAEWTSENSVRKSATC